MKTAVTKTAAAVEAPAAAAKAAPTAGQGNCRCEHANMSVLREIVRSQRLDACGNR